MPLEEEKNLPQNPEKEELSPEGRERRNFIKSFLVYSGVAVAASIAVPGALSAVMIIAKKKDGPSDQSLEEAKELSTNSNKTAHNNFELPDPSGSPEFTVDQRHTLNGIDLRNLGVEHSRAFFEHNKQLFTKAISEADIVILERKSYFFLQISKLAEDLGKKVIFLEEVVKSEERIAKICTYVSTALAGLCILKSKKLSSGDIKEISTWTGGLVSALALSLNGIYSPPMIRGVLTNQYPIEDISYALDARTVKMLKNLLALSNSGEAKGQRALTITGNQHALGFEYYLNNPEAFATRQKLHHYLHPRLNVDANGKK